MELLDIAPSYPLKEVENWRVLTMESESGVEQRVSRWAYPKREWELKWVGAVRATETDPIRSFLNRMRGPTHSFLWREPHETSRNRVLLGYGDGSRTNWLVPVTNAGSLVFHVNSTIVAPSISSGTGTGGCAVATFSAPGSGMPVDFDYADGYYHPVVRLKDNFTYILQGPISYGELSFAVVETKEGHPVS